MYLTICISGYEVTRPVITITDRDDASSDCRPVSQCKDFMHILEEDLVRDKLFCTDNHSINYDGCPDYQDLTCLCVDPKVCSFLKPLIERNDYDALKIHETCGYSGFTPNYCCPLPIHLNPDKATEFDESSNTGIGTFTGIGGTGTGE